MKLDLSDRGLTTLDGIDLSGVTKLNCWGNQLTSLPPLPSSLEELDCDTNQLTSLPDLPSLIKLSCDTNRLTSLPPLPSSLEELFCDNNQLTSLPPLPSSLKILSCSFNDLTSLPDLPWGLHWMWDEVKLSQYNKRRADLGMDIVDMLPDNTTWDEVDQAHLIWQYRLGGEKWAKACNTLTLRN